MGSSKGSYRVNFQEVQGSFGQKGSENNFVISVAYNPSKELEL